MIVGEILIIRANDPEVESGIPRWVKKNGHDLIKGEKNNDDIFEFMIMKKKEKET